MTTPVTSVAAAYDRFMVPGLFAAWAHRAVEVARLRPGDSVLDVACGSGVVACEAAKIAGSSGRVAGVDIDAGCIEYDRERSRERGDGIEWHCASALELPFGDSAFDACICQHGLQFFPDPVQGLREMRRVLKAQGRLVALTWGPLDQNSGHHVIVQALEKRGVDASAAKRSTSISDPDRLRDLAVQAGFNDASVKVETGRTNFESIDVFLEAQSKGSPSTRHAIALVPEADRPAFFEEVRAALQPYCENGTLKYPMRANVLTATRAGSASSSREIYR